MKPVASSVELRETLEKVRDPSESAQKTITLKKR
jgi:hypothetical protein